MIRRPPSAIVGAILGVVLLVSASCAGNELHAATGSASTTSAPSTSPSPTSAPAGSPPARPTTTNAPGGWRPQALRWSNCPSHAGFKCATLSVPLDWTDPAGTTIELALARQPATGRRQGYLVANPGGPGASGLDFAYGNPFSDAIRARYDIVGWDPRGVGRSTHLRCGSKVDPFLAQDPDPDTPAEQAALDGAAKAVADQCAGSDLALLSHMGTDDVARDLEAIRTALGGQPLNFFGFSYGTYIGLRYASLFPTHIRSMVLDGVLDPTQKFADWLAGQAKAIDASLTRVFAACTRSSGCPVDDLAATYDQVRAKVEQAPLHTDQGRPLGPAELATAALYVSYDPSNWRLLGPALADAAQGDGTALMNLAQGYYDFGGFTAYAGVECIDSTHPTGSAEYADFAHRLEQISPRFGGNVANELLPCAYWPVPPQDHTGPVRADGAPPILVLGNRGDPETPYQNSVAVAGNLADGHLVSNNGEGHTSYGRNGCITEVADRYVLDLRVPSSDPDCR